MFRFIKDTLRYWFYHRVETAFTISNENKALVVIRPRLLARIWNDLELGTFYMERSINRHNKVSWIAPGPKGSKIVAHEGMAIFNILETAYKKNQKRLLNIPDPVPVANTFIPKKDWAFQQREDNEDDAN